VSKATKADEQISRFMRFLRAQFESINDHMVDDLYSNCWRALREADRLVPESWSEEDRVRHDLKYLLAYVLARIEEAATEPEEDVTVVEVADAEGHPIPREVLDMLGSALADRIGGPVMLRPAPPERRSEAGKDNAGGVH
jgi:hypothetical protein